MVAFTKHDLGFILEGIEVSQSHADLSITDQVNATGNWNDQAGLDESRQILIGLLPNPLEPIGMRTINGDFNNLTIGQESFGAVDQEFPRLLDPDYRDDGATGLPEDPVDVNGPNVPGGIVTNTDYSDPGTVIDSDPRLISNLIADQSVRNPAAISAALAKAGFEGDVDVAIAEIQAAYDARLAAQQAAGGASQAVIDAQAALAAEQADLAAAQAVLDAANTDLLAAQAAEAQAQTDLANAQAAAVNAAADLATAQAALTAALAAQTTANDTLATEQATLAGLDATLQTALADLATAQATLAAVQADPLSTPADIANAQAAVDAAQTVADTAQADVDAQQTVVDGAQTDADAAQAAVDAAQADVDAQQALLDAVTAADAALTQATADVATAQAAVDAAQPVVDAEQIEADAAQAALDAAVAADGANNTALTDAQAIIDDYGLEIDAGGFILIENTAPDEGLSAPFNTFMTIFGQFFDHGLDKFQAGTETVFIPLQPDDPLITLGRDGIAGTGDELTDPSLQFMAITRAAVDAGPDGILGTADDVQDVINVTSPFIDQNQTYGGNPSHAMFMREYADSATGPVSTGLVLEGAGGGLPTWAELKQHAAQFLGVQLTDMDALNIPLFAVDQYGEFLKGANGYPQVVLADGTMFELPSDGSAMTMADVEAAAGQLVQRTGHVFLEDIAGDSKPVDRNGIALIRHEDGNANDGINGGAGTYDGDKFDAHYVAGDGRVNENFGLTATHHVFHQEHNRLIQHTKDVLTAIDPVQNGDLGTVGDLNGDQAALELLNGYLLEPVATFPATQAEIDALVWDGDRLFQAAKFAMEMEYQHLVFEEFGRKVQPLIDLFAAFEPAIDPSITAEFAHTVYRFGHSMLTENVDLMDENGNLTEAGLIQAFLNPLGFNVNVTADGTVTDQQVADQQIDGAAEEAAGALLRGMTREAGNEIDNFVTPALRSNLLGLPLDLGAINIARGRETGVPTLNDARAQFFAGTGDTKLEPYSNWVDFAQNAKDEYSVVNFIAAYGQHEAITSFTDIATKRANAWALVTGEVLPEANLVNPDTNAAIDISDRVDFLMSTGAWAAQETGLNLIDFWIGGLAEKTEPFGGMLGSTFNFVFEEQMEDLQDGDRFYYLGRTAGLNFVTQLEQNSFANMVVRTTSVGDQNLLAEGGDGLGGDHLPGDIFSVPAWILEANINRQVTGLDANGDPVTDGSVGRGDPTDEDTLFFSTVIRVDANNDGIAEYLEYTGGEHVVLGGTDGAGEHLVGGIGDDTLWGDGGDDRLEGGDGADILLGGDGDDIITDIGGPDNIQGQAGNDYIFSGEGEDLILAGEGKDFVINGPGLGEVFGGQGDDFITSGTEGNTIFGGEGDDWLEGDGGANLLQGDNGDPFLNSTVEGNDIFVAGQGDNDYDAEGGDDVMEGGDGFQGFEGQNGFDWATYRAQDQGVQVDMNLQAFNEAPIPPSNASILDKFDSVEGISGSRGSDVIKAVDRVDAEFRSLDNGNDSVLRNFELIRGLRAGDHAGFDDVAIFDAGQTEFSGGEIMLGGAGADILEGRMGDDIIDGDLMLDIKLLVLDPVDGTPLAAAYRMQGQLFAVGVNGETLRDAAGDPLPITLGGHATLDQAIFHRVVNPGDVHGTREIIDLNPYSDLANFDTAVFSGVRAEYAIETDAMGEIGDGDGDGYITVSHLVADADGTDRLRNIERLQFSDQAIDLTGGAGNQAPTGELAITDLAGNPVAAPFVGQILTVDVSAIMDADGITGFDGVDRPGLDGAGFAVEWEWEQTPGAGDFIGFEVANGAGEDAGLTGTQIEVPIEAQGFAIRAKLRYQDANGVLETVISAGTPAIGPAGDPVATAGADILFGTAFDDTIDGLEGNDQIFGLSGNDTLFGRQGDDRIEGGFGDDIIRGNGGNDTLLGQEGNDNIRGGGAGDIIEGGVGDDDLQGRGGSDTFIWNVGDGNDSVDGNGNPNGNGNGGTDTFVVNGDDSDETFAILADEVNLAALVFRNGIQIATLVNIEDVVINAAGGNNVLALVGNFDGILAPNTVTFNGGAGNDTVDVSALTSQTGLLFRSGGGTDTVLGTLPANTVLEVAPGLTPADFGPPVDNGNGTITFTSNNGQNVITVEGDVNNPPVLAEDSTPDPTPEFALSALDIAALEDLVNGVQNAVSNNPAATGVRDLEGTGNNAQSPDEGAADQPFIRLTDARQGADDANGNKEVNVIFKDLDPRDISNTIVDQEAGLPDQANGGTVLFMAFGQYLDHGLDFLPKGGNGTIEIGGPGFAPTGNPIDLTRGTVDGTDANGATQHTNKTSPFADQNQAYGSTELVGQFLRESDGAQGVGARLLTGGVDPSSPEHDLLPTLREVIQHHWAANTIFFDAAKMAAPVAFQDAFPGLVDAMGNVDAMLAADLNSDFLGSGHDLIGDRNPGIDLLDHVVAGDLRANENYMLTSIHTIWARNHNFHVENLEAQGFTGTPEELFQAAKIINEAEYQIIVFDEYANALIGGIQSTTGGGGDHGWDGYNANATAAISHEFAAAAFRIGHSLITETIVLGDGSEVSLLNAFLNPTNANGGPAGYQELGVDEILGGVATQPASEIDVNIVDAVRDNLFSTPADLGSFNIARGRDVGLGTLNQVRADLMNSTDPYVQEAISFLPLGTDLTPYTSWADFQTRNGLTNAVIQQFQDAYPDLTLTDAGEIAQFQATNPDIGFTDNGDGSITIAGVDRVDFWVGGLAETHVNGGMVGSSFFVVLHEQFDRLQEADRFYYLDRIDGSDFYNIVDAQTFGDIVARNSSLDLAPNADLFTGAVEGVVVDPIVAAADTAATLEDQLIDIDVIGNDAASDGGDVAIIAISQPTNGSAVLNNGGTPLDVTDDSIIYTPDAEFSGQDSFTYTIQDATGATATATVDVTVTAVNDAPVAADDAATTQEDVAAIIDVLANDTDVDSAVLTVTQATGDSGGAVVINPDGTLGYTPAAGFSGVELITYTVSDGALTDTATVTVTVQPAAPVAPTANDDAATTDEDMAVTISVLANDVDDGVISITANGAAANGAVVDNGDGTITYTPNADFNGADSFTYTITDDDGLTDTATVNVTVNPVNDAPVAADDAATTQEDVATTIDVLANDTDVDSAMLTVTQATGDSGGAVVINPDGTLGYTPAAGFVGTETITYTVSDGDLIDTASVTVTVTAAPVDTPPTAVDDAATTDEDVAVSIDLLANDSDVEGPVSIQSVGAAGNGTIVDNGDGTVTYTPNMGFSGQDSFTYTIVDSAGQTATATATVDVNAAAPTGPTPFFVSQGGVFDGTAGTPIVLPHAANMEIAEGAIELFVNLADANGRQGLFSKDSGGNDTGGHVGVFAVGNALLVRMQDANTANGGTNTTFTIQTGNVLTVGQDHHIALTFGPAGMELFVDGASVGSNAYTGGLIGNQEPVVLGGNQWTSGNQVADVIVDPLNGTIAGANIYNTQLTAAEVDVLANGEPVTPPNAVVDAANVDEDASVLVDVLGNDTDPNMEALTLIAAAGASNGTVAVENGQVRYTPNADFAGTDSFTYTVQNASGGTATATATVTVASVNDAPTAADDAANTLVDQAVDIDLLANDSDVDGDMISISGIGAAGSGTVLDNGDGTVTYTPNAGFEGQDTFTYTITDGALTDTATVTVDVTAEPVGPVPVFTASNVVTDAFTVISDDPAFDNASGSIEVAFNIDTISNSRKALFSKDSLGFGDGGHTLAYVRGDDLTVRLQSDSGQVELTIANQITAGQDHHLVVNFGANGFEVHLDGGAGSAGGSFVFDQAFLQGMDMNNEDFVIGGNAWFTFPGANFPIVDTIDGSVVEFSVYDRDLTDEEIADQASEYVTIL